MTSPIVPTETDIEVVQGATFRMQVTWKDDQATPQPKSLTGYRAHMQFRSKVSNTSALILDLASIGSSPALTIEPDDQVGVVAIRIPATATALLRKNCYYDLFVIEQADQTFAVRLIAGAVDVSLSATQDTSP